MVAIRRRSFITALRRNPNALKMVGRKKAQKTQGEKMLTTKYPPSRGALADRHESHERGREEGCRDLSFVYSVPAVGG